MVNAFEPVTVPRWMIEAAAQVCSFYAKDLESDLRQALNDFDAER